MDDVTAMIAGQIGKFLPMDEETAEQFRQLAKRMMEQVGKKLQKNICSFIKQSGGLHETGKKRKKE